MSTASTQTELLKYKFFTWFLVSVLFLGVSFFIHPILFSMVLISLILTLTLEYIFDFKVFREVITHKNEFLKFYEKDYKIHRDFELIEKEASKKTSTRIFKNFISILWYTFISTAFILVLRLLQVINLTDSDVVDKVGKLKEKVTGTEGYTFYNSLKLNVREEYQRTIESLLFPNSFSGEVLGDYIISFTMVFGLVFLIGFLYFKYLSNISQAFGFYEKRKLY